MLKSGYFQTRELNWSMLHLYLTKPYEKCDNFKTMTQTTIHSFYNMAIWGEKKYSQVPYIRVHLCKSKNPAQTSLSVNFTQQLEMKFTTISNKKYISARMGKKIISSQMPPRRTESCWRPPPSQTARGKVKKQEEREIWVMTSSCPRTF